MSLTDERNRERSTSKAEPMDWSTTRSETSLPSPVRSRSRSGSPSPPRAITINLFPLSDSIEFAPKHLSFNPDQEIKVGRVSGSRNQKEAKPDNGVFSCDVMSREHALLKEENGKILIKDLKSTHGTFVNNVRLGDGTEESDWRILNHGDVITFGHSVRRNQNLYKHLSAYIFYPKETRDDIHSPSNGNTLIEPISSPSTIKVERVERTSENMLLPPLAITQEATSVASTGISQSSMLQSRNEGPASYYIAKSGGLSSTTSSVTNPLGNKFGGLPVTKPRTTDNITQASEALVTESKQNSTTSNTSEEMLTSIQKLKIGQPDEKSHITVEKVESKEPTARSGSQEDNGDISMENNENFKDSNNVDNGHKLVSPEITPDTNPVGITEEETVIQTATRTTTTVSFVAPAPVKDRATTHITRETKQSKVSRREKETKESNADKGENELIVSNGEGPSHVTEDDSSAIVSSITSRKRKFEEVDDEENGPEAVNNLKEKIAALEVTVNKRRKRDIVYSCVIGMVAGAVSIGACAYVFGA